MEPNSNTLNSLSLSVFQSVFSRIAGKNNEDDPSSSNNEPFISNPMEEKLRKIYSNSLINNTELIQTFEQIFQDLSKMGYPPKQIIHAMLIWKYKTIDQYIDALSEINGKMNHYFIESDEGRCFVCQNIEANHKVFLRDEMFFSNIDNNENELQTEIGLNVKQMKQKPKPNISNDNSNNENIINADNNNNDNNICQICFDELPPETFQLKCSHQFCKECIIEYLKEEINNSRVSKINCPYPKCKEQFNENNVTYLLDELYVNKYRKFLFRENFKNDSSFLPCPIVNCDGYAKKSKHSSTKQIRLECNYGHPFCSQCNQAWHGEEPCSVDPEIKEFATYSGFILKKCPQCKAWTEKNKGCNHMHCKMCEYDWCWLCQQHCPQNHYFVRGTPCYGKLFDNQQMEFEQMENMLILVNTPFIIQCIFSLYVLTIFFIRNSLTRILRNRNNQINLLIPYEDIENNIRNVNFNNVEHVNPAGVNLIQNDIIIVDRPRNDIPPKYGLIISFLCWILILFVFGLLINFYIFTSVNFNGTSVANRGLLTKKLWSLTKIIIILFSYFTIGPILSLTWAVFSFGYAIVAIIRA